MKPLVQQNSWDFWTADQGCEKRSTVEAGCITDIGWHFQVGASAQVGTCKQNALSHFKLLERWQPGFHWP